MTSSKNTLCGLPMEAEGVVAPYVAWNTGLHMHGISWRMHENFGCSKTPESLWDKCACV